MHPATRRHAACTVRVTLLSGFALSHAGKAAGAGVNMLYASLKFTGLALSVAGGLAKAVRLDAERMVKELEADAAAKVRPPDELLLCWSGLYTAMLVSGVQCRLQKLSECMQALHPVA